MRSAEKKIATVAAVLLVVSITVISWRLLHSPPPPRADAPEQTAEYLASDDFAGLDYDDKTDYLEQVRTPESDAPLLALLSNPAFDEKKRQQLMRNILPAVAPVIRRRVEEYEKLPPAEQTARLDGIIDQIIQYRQNNPQAAPSPERLNLILQNLDPYTRAKLREHIPDLQQRMEQRGIAPSPMF